tara:strand:+ start:788 stop:1738 length:951 start_codon:yes stop_codon:yes gene_type:complete
MITGFLFYSKILRDRDKETDWTYLYTSRLLRLTPLYLFAILTMFTIVTFVSDNEHIEPLKNSINNAVKWILFTIPGAPDLNGVKSTSIIMAGVTWSLPYEWLFYASLPVISLLAAGTARLTTVAMSTAAIVCIINVFDPASIHIKTFIGGMLCAAMLYKNIGSQLVKSSTYSLFIIALLAILVINFPTSHGNIQLGILTLVFYGIASGNNLFGILSLKISRTLGEMAYSIYLLHGIILYIYFNFIVTKEAAQSLTPDQYWLTMFAITPAIIILSTAAYLLIEKPAMDRTHQASEKVKGIYQSTKQTLSYLILKLTK